MNIEDVLAKLQKVRKIGGNKWKACCPAHADKNPSLSIKYVDGKILLHCFAGCTVLDITAALGIELTDIMPPRDSVYKSTKPPRFNKYELFDTLVFEVLILCAALRQLDISPLSTTDLSRVIQAEATIDDIVREVIS